MTLLVKPCSYEAAKYAVENWHYSRTMPQSKLIKFGVWEDRRFVGAVVYGHGANNQLGQPYGLDATEVGELVRIALREHAAPVTQIVAETIRQVKATNPGLRLIISFADPEQRHHGGIYQAGNWLYTGTTRPQRELLINGVFWHKRAANNTYGTASVPALRRILGVPVEPSPAYFKHRYLMPLDKAMRRRVARLVEPAPKPYADHAVEASAVTRPAPGREMAGSIPAHRSTIPAPAADSDPARTLTEARG